MNYPSLFALEVRYTTVMARKHEIRARNAKNIKTRRVMESREKVAITCKANRDINYRRILRCLEVLDLPTTVEISKYISKEPIPETGEIVPASRSVVYKWLMDMEEEGQIVRRGIDAHRPIWDLP